MFVNDKWMYKVRDDLSTNSDDIEMLWLEIDKDSTGTQRNQIVGTIYRRPGSCPTDFNHKLQEILEILSLENSDIIHMGDYNLNLLSSDTHMPTNEFAEINFAQSLFPTINKPTRITATTATLIDNIFAPSSVITNCLSGILMWDISDHFPVFLVS